MKANARKSAAGKAAGKRNVPGNVTLDVGEEVDSLIRHGVRTGYRGGQLGSPGGLFGRPGMFSNFRMGVDRSTLGAALDMPATARPIQVVGGALVGAAANKVLRRAIPYVVKSITSSVVVDGISAVVGVLPYLLARKNGFTIGFAIPGLLNLAGTIVDKVLDVIKVLPAPTLSGPRPQGIEMAGQRLNALQNRMNVARMSQFRPTQMAGRTLVPGRRVAV